MFADWFRPAPGPSRRCRPELEELSQRLVPSTVQSFDRRGTPFAASVGASPPGAAVLPGGPTGRFIRLANDAVPTNNSIAFPVTRAGAARRVLIDFDFRVTPAFGRADGFGLALLNSSAFGRRGGVNPQGPFFVPEDPLFRGSIGVGFDIFQSFDLGDVNNNHVSVHFNGRTLYQTDATPALDLAGGQWVHGRVEIRFARRFATVTVALTPPGGLTAVLLDRVAVPAARAYEGRLWFGARSGGFSALHDLDNVRGRFLGR